MSKPPFDPNQPFASAKPEFDPNAPFTAIGQDQAQTEDPSYASPGSWLNKAADMSQSAQNAVIGPIVRGVASGSKALSRGAFGTEAPANFVGKGIQAVGNGIRQGEEYVSGKLGEWGVNPYIAGAVPVVGENVAAMMLPAEKIAGTMFKPVIPAERQAVIQAAKEAGIPLSRAEMTGGKFISALENRTEKTPLGSIPMGKARSSGDAAMQAYLDRLQNEMGTPKENFDVGYQAKPAMASRDAAMNTARSQKFDAVPTDVHIPLHESVGTADQILQEQSQYLPTTRNGDVIAIAKDVQNAHNGISSGEGVTGGPEIRGVTTRTADQVIPGHSIITEHGGEVPANSSYSFSDGEIKPDASNPTHYTAEVTPDQTIPGKNIYGVKYGFSPEETMAPKPNYQLLKRLRETLDGKAQEARMSGNFSAERDYLRLKSSVDKDISTYVDTSGDAAFSSSYKQANAFSGAYKNLFKSDLATAVEGAPPEKILGMVFQKNNETAIKQFHALVGDQAFQQVKRKWVSDLLQSPNVSQALSEKKIDPGTLNAILTKPEQEALSKYGLVQGLRKTVGNLQGTQGSARSNVHSLSYEGLGGGLVGLATGHPAIAAAGIGQFVAPYAVGKALTSRAATEGINYAIPGVVRNAAIAAFISKITTKDNAQ